MLQNIGISDIKWVTLLEILSLECLRNYHFILGLPDEMCGNITTILSNMKNVNSNFTFDRGDYSDFLGKLQEEILECYGKQSLEDIGHWFKTIVVSFYDNKPLSIWTDVFSRMFSQKQRYKYLTNIDMAVRDNLWKNYDTVVNPCNLEQDLINIRNSIFSKNDIQIFFGGTRIIFDLDDGGISGVFLDVYDIIIKKRSFQYISDNLLKLPITEHKAVCDAAYKVAEDYQLPYEKIANLEEVMYNVRS